jgi:hypothetical protein
MSTLPLCSYGKATIKASQDCMQVQCELFARATGLNQVAVALRPPVQAERSLQSGNPPGSQ